MGVVEIHGGDMEYEKCIEDGFGDLAEWRSGLGSLGEARQNGIHTK